MIKVFLAFFWEVELAFEGEEYSLVGVLIHIWLWRLTIFNQNIIFFLLTVTFHQKYY